MWLENEANARRARCWAPVCWEVLLSPAGGSPHPGLPLCPLQGPQGWQTYQDKTSCTWCLCRSGRCNDTARTGWLELQKSVVSHLEAGSLRSGSRCGWVLRGVGWGGGSSRGAGSGSSLCRCCDRGRGEGALWSLLCKSTGPTAGTHPPDGSPCVGPPTPSHCGWGFNTQIWGHRRVAYSQTWLWWTVRGKEWRKLEIQDEWVSGRFSITGVYRISATGKPKALWFSLPVSISGMFWKQVCWKSLYELRGVLFWAPFFVEGGFSQS